MNRKKIVGIITLLLALVSLNGQAQCSKVNNIYFQAGEELIYDLYFKYGLINTKAGVSTLTTTSQKYNGVDAYKMVMTAKSSGVVNKMFSINDTLSAFTTKDLQPLAFVKNAKEGGDHTLENLTYSYKNGTTSVHAKRVKNGTLRFDETITAQSCIYDLVSVVFYARTLDYSKMKKGDEVRVDFLSGKKKGYMLIEYQGLETIEANDKKKYSCMKLVLSVVSPNKDTFEDKEESMKVFLTNDNNRMPVRLDSKLKFGSTRAMLKGYKGNKYPVSVK